MDINNIVVKKSKGIGWAFLGSGILLFALYWVVLLTAVQSHAVVSLQETGRPHVFVATFVGAVLIGFIAGVIVATLLYLGFTFLNLWWGKWQSDLAEVKWHDVFMLTSYRIWTIVGGVLFVLFTLLWRGDL